MKRLYAGLCLASLLVLHPRVLGAQAVPPGEPGGPGVILTPITVDIIVARYTGEKADKKISSVPYSLAVSATTRGAQQGPQTSLRMGNKVPIPNVVLTSDNKPAPGAFTSFNYQDMGINIDARAGVRSDGRFEVLLTLEETSVAPTGNVQGFPVVGSATVIRSFRLSDTVILRDGETRQFTAATDRITGETVKIDVTVKSVK